RPLTSSSSSLPPSSSLSAHASYHVQSHPAPEPGYGAQPNGHDSAGHPAANYRPGGLNHHPQQSQQHGSDRPDYGPSDASSNCCRNRYPETASSHAHSNQGGSYASHSTSGPSALSYGGGDSGHRPSGAGGSWNYVSSGTTAGHSGPSHGVNSGHVGVSINTHGSYGESHSAPQGQYSGGGSSSSHEYGANRGSDHRRESDHRQQSHLRKLSSNILT
uniref:Uncharacterized protein n=1 Tax=Anopheles maculatus TaxID=74869 RepID=A0A182SS24_9DIPT